MRLINLIGENAYRTAQQAGGIPDAIDFPFNTMGEGWNLRGNNYALWVINEIHVDPDTSPCEAGCVGGPPCPPACTADPPCPGDANRDCAIDGGDQFYRMNRQSGDESLSGEVASDYRGPYVSFRAFL